MAKSELNPFQGQGYPEKILAPYDAGPGRNLCRTAQVSSSFLMMKKVSSSSKSGEMVATTLKPNFS